MGGRRVGEGAFRKRKRKRKEMGTCRKRRRTNDSFPR